MAILTPVVPPADASMAAPLCPERRGSSYSVPSLADSHISRLYYGH